MKLTDMLNSPSSRNIKFQDKVEFDDQPILRLIKTVSGVTLFKATELSVESAIYRSTEQNNFGQDAKGTRAYLRGPELVVPEAIQKKMNALTMADQPLFKAFCEIEGWENWEEKEIIKSYSYNIVFSQIGARVDETKLSFSPISNRQIPSFELNKKQVTETDFAYLPNAGLTIEQLAERILWDMYGKLTPEDQVEMKSFIATTKSRTTGEGGAAESQQIKTPSGDVAVNAGRPAIGKDDEV